MMVWKMFFFSRGVFSASMWIFPGVNLLLETISKFEFTCRYTCTWTLQESIAKWMVKGAIKQPCGVPKITLWRVTLSTYDYDFHYSSLPVIPPQLGCLVSPMIEWYLQLGDSSTTWVAYFFRRHLTSMWQIFMRLGHSNFWKDRDVFGANGRCKRNQYTMVKNRNIFSWMARNKNTTKLKSAN